MSAEVYSEKMNEDIFSCLPKIEEVSPIDGEWDINDHEFFCKALQEYESTQEAHEERVRQKVDEKEVQESVYEKSYASNALIKLFFSS